MDLIPQPELIPGAIGVICWLIAYVLIIRRGYLDKSYGMPAPALLGNITWEFVFAFLIAQNYPGQRVANILWFGMDIIILAQLMRYGRKSFPQILPFRTSIAVVLALYTTIWYASAIQFNDPGGGYSGFVLALIGSFWYIPMLANRKSSRGQSMYIAVLKMIATAGYSITFWIMFHRGPLFTVLYLWIFAFDLIYCVMLYRQIRAEGINPLKRV